MITDNDWLILRAIEKYNHAYCGPEVIAREACFSISHVVKRLRVLEEEKLVESVKAKVDERSARYVYKLKEVCNRKEAEDANIAHNLQRKWRIHRRKQDKMLFERLAVAQEICNREAARNSTRSVAEKVRFIRIQKKRGRRMKLMTARQIAKKYHRTMSGVYLIIRREKIEPVERRGNCNFYDAKEVAKLVTSNDTTSRDGEISIKELMRLHGLKRNALHSILLTKHVKPIRSLEGYRGLVFYDKVEAELAIEDNKNNTAKLAEYITGKKLLTTNDLCKLIGLSSNNAFSWAKNRNIKSLSVIGSKFALFNYDEVMPHVEKYNADKKRLEEIKDSADLITRNQIAARFNVTRQRVSQVIIKHNIQPVENLRVRQDARLFYRTSEIERYFGNNNLEDNEITAKGLMEWFRKSSSMIFYAIRRMKLKPVSKVRYGTAVYDRSDAIKKIHKYFKAREARQSEIFMINPKNLEVRTQKNSDTTTFEMGIEFDQCYNAISVVLKKCKVAPIARKAGSNAFLYDRKRAIEVLTGFYENENYLEELLAKSV